MTKEEFQGLKYGNVISDKRGLQKFVVLHTLRDADGTTSVGVLPAILIDQAEKYKVVDDAHSETFLAERLVPGTGTKETYLNGRTVKA